MSHFHPHLTQEFLKNRELNHFYWAIALITFGEALISIFVPIYLYEIGYPIYQIVFFYLLMSLFFVLLAYPGARLVSRLGDKHSILLSNPPLIAFYLGLSAISDFPFLFWVLPFLMALGVVLYNFGYHLNFINNSARHQRGRELSYIGIVNILITASAPFIGGLLAANNFSLLLIIGSGFMLFGSAPLFLSHDDYEPIRFSFRDIYHYIFNSSNRGNFISFSGYAIENSIGRVLWPVFLIIILGTTTKTGLIVSTSMIASVILFYIMGKITDRQDKIKLLRLGTVMYFFAWVGRLFADSAYKIFFIDSYKNISEKVLQLPWSAHAYDLAGRGDRFAFIVSRETIFNLSRLIFLPLIVLIFLIDFHPFLLSFLIATLASLGYVFINK